MKEISYGIIPIKRLRMEWKVLLLQHGKKHWAFPKGHSELTETPRETARRELYEESGLRVKAFLNLDPLEENYIFTWKGNKVFKKVVYFPAVVKGKVTVQQSEISDSKWVHPLEGVQLATFPETKKLCRKIAQLFYT